MITTHDVDQLLLTLFTSSMEECEATDPAVRESWRARKNRQLGEIRKLALAFGLIKRGTKVLRGESFGVIVEVAAPNAIAFFCNEEDGA